MNWQTVLHIQSLTRSLQWKLILFIACFSLSFSVSCSCALASSTKLLFSIPYGDKQGQIPFQAARAELDDDQEPSNVLPTLRVSQDGQKIFVMHKDDKAPASLIIIQVFDATGKLLQTVEFQTSEDCDFMAGRERFYLFSHQRVQVFGQDGKLLRDISQRISRVIGESEFTFLSLLGEDSQQSLYFKVLNSHRPQGQRLNTVRLSSSDQVLLIEGTGVVHPESNALWRISIIEQNPSQVTQRGYRLDGTLDFEQLGEPYSKRKIEVLDALGEVQRTVIFPALDLSPEEQTILFYSVNDKVSSSGHLFVTAEKRTMRQARRGDYLFYEGFQVLEYDALGRYQGVRAQLLEPVGSATSDCLPRLWDIDRAGNLYYLDFQADHLRVMKVPAR